MASPSPRPRHVQGHSQHRVTDVVAELLLVLKFVKILGAGRVVAFSGQDFISSGDRSTLLGVGDVDTLLTNAAGWASQVDNLAEANVLAANDAVANILLSGAFTQVAVADAFLPNGLWEVRDWSAENLAGKDLAVVQVNEWGTLHLDPADIANLRTFDTGDPEKMALWNIKTAGIAWWHDHFVGFDKAGARGV